MTLAVVVSYEVITLLANLVLVRHHYSRELIWPIDTGFVVPVHRTPI